MFLRHDIPFAFRQLRRSPGFTATVLFALALGIGANTAVFTLVNAVLFRGLPFPESDRIVHVMKTRPSQNQDRLAIALPEFRDWQKDAKSFEVLAAFENARHTLIDPGSPPERFRGARVTSNTFPLTGATPILGRDFTPEDEKPGAPLVVLIGHRVWENRYGRDRSIIGRQVTLDEKPATIIGVMPERFRFPQDQDLWTPLRPEPRHENREQGTVRAVGLLKRGVPMAEARAEMSVLARGYEKSYPKENQGKGTLVETFNDAYNGGNIRAMFLAILGAVGLVLLVVVANVSNLMLGRALARGRELSIRAAIGAGRWPIIRQLLTESVILSVAGGLLGLLLARWGIHAFSLATADVGKPYWIEFTFDWTVFAYFASVCLLTGVLFGLLPAWHASRLDLATSMRDQARAGLSRTMRWFTGGLVVSEVAFSVVLLIGAGLLIRSFLAFGKMNPQMPASQILQFYVVTPAEQYKTVVRRQQLSDQLRSRLRQLPGVSHLALASHEPLGGANGWNLEIEEQPLAQGAKRPQVSGLLVTPDYFAAIGSAVLQGRDFREDDGEAGRENILVNQAFVAKYFPRAGGALGKRVRVDLEGHEKTWLTIAGIVPDLQQGDVQAAEREPLIYAPWRMAPPGAITVLARAEVPPSTLITPARRVVSQIDANLPVNEPRTVAETTERRRWAWRVFGTMFSIFSLIGVTLAAVGLYGVVAHSVRQRTAEIGIRMALGATPGRVLSLVMRSGVVQLALGLLVGLAGAAGLTRFIRTMLVQVTPTDPATFALVAGVLALVALAACFLPARRAAAIDPVRALRQE